MTFRKLVSILCESADEYDDWSQWLEEESYGIPLDDVRQLISDRKLSVSHLIKNKIVVLFDKDRSAVLSFDGQDFEWLAEKTEDLSEWINQLDVQECLDYLGIEEHDVWMSGLECTIRDCQENPGIVYHYTTEEKWAAIQKTGYQKGSYGTGLTNRQSFGIFCSVDPEVYADGTYGDVCLALNLSGYKNEAGLKEIQVSPEPEVFEAEVKNSLAHKLGLENYDSYVSSDMSQMTIIVHDNIPLKFISVYGN